MSVLLLFLPRKYAPVPILVTMCYMTLGQWVYTVGIHLNSLRILILIGAVRIVTRERSTRITFNTIDKAIVTFIAVATIAWVILYRSSSSLITQFGYAYNDLGIYFIFRFLVQDQNDVTRVFRQLAIISVPLAVLMLVENSTGRNIFSLLGGVPEFSEIRDGRLRCQGPFRHPILAGTYGATIFPFFVALVFREGSDRALAMVGMIAATIITITSASSGPVLTYGFVVLGLLAWKLRAQMRMVRWSIVALLIMLQIIMKDPVWYLYARVSGVMGGTGWHRSELIQQFLAHANEWWLVGTTYTAHWMLQHLPANPDMVDITNQYILVGVNGGLLSMALFIRIIVKGFKKVGVFVKEDQRYPFSELILVWSLGCALLGHVVTFMSVSYFDQLNVSWFLLLAMIATIQTHNAEGGSGV